jgi:hypothetical protein
MYGICIIMLNKQKFISMDFENKKLQESKKEEKQATGEGITRREFLRGAGAVGATVLLEAIYPKASLAKLKEVLDYEKVEFESYEEGIERLREDVFQKDHEVNKFYFKSKKEFETGFLKKQKRNSCWYEGRGSKGSGDVVYTPRKSYEVLLQDPVDLEEVKLVHTHPYISSQIFRKKAEETGVELDSERVRPISFSSMDIFNSLKLSYEFPNSEGIISQEVVEPTGVWKYKVDAKNEKMIKVFSEIRETEEKIKNLPKEEKLARKKIACDIFMEEMNLEIKPENYSDKGLIDFEIQSLPNWKTLRELIDGKQFEIFCARKEDREQMINQAIGEYSRWGIESEYKTLK